MYLQLGDIKFEALLGFESFTDSIEATYAEHALINRKPHLQRTGDGLKEFTGKINFHSSFCVPENEHQKLENKRFTGEIMPLIYGNGKYEGDYILVSITRTPLQTDPTGAYVYITCDISLKEAGGFRTAAQRQEQATAAAFALTSNRPLPVNSSVLAVNNPALDVANNNKVAGQAGASVSGELDSVDAKVKAVPDPLETSIPPAQKFMDMVPSITAKINRYLGEMQDSLTLLTALFSANPTLSTYAPAMSANITSAETVMIAMQSLITNLSSLPNPVNTTPDALTILDIQQDSVILGQELVDALDALNQSSSGIAGALATKAKVTNA